jgi:CubicO group peptidase (beta-lactamase class C family)
MLSLVAPSAEAGPRVKDIPTAPAVSLERAKAHRIKPVLVGAELSPEDLDGPSAIDLSNLPKFKVRPKLDTVGFANDLHAVLKDTRGHALQVRRNGTPEMSYFWDWGRTPQDGAKGWSLDRRMHIASVSKLITAMVIVDLLDEKGISVDAKIGPYIPGYWTVGANVADITFRDLLTHRSGFVSSDGSFLAMKSVVAKPVPATVEKPAYQNVNFSILRVLGAVVAGAVEVPFTSPTYQDQIWDILATDWFVARANSRIFAPAGVSNVSAVPNAEGAIGYASKTDTSGMINEDLTSIIGGAGFRMSVNELLSVMDAFRRRGTIVSNAVAKTAIQDLLGLDLMIDTPAGKLYTKNGGWADGAGNNEQSVVFFMPENIEIAIHMNSPLPNGADLTNTVITAYLNNLKQ